MNTDDIWLRLGEHGWYHKSFNISCSYADVLKLRDILQQEAIEEGVKLRYEIYNNGMFTSDTNITMYVYLVYKLWL